MAGNAQLVGAGLTKFLVHHGKGYRLYFKHAGNAVIIILCGDDKSPRSKDINKAKLLAKELIEKLI